MSNTSVFTVSNAVYEQAKQDATARAAKQWSDWLMNPKSVNMWEEYHTTLSDTWVDPWYEAETHGIFNGPSTGPDDPAYEMTQNFYMAYCWLKWKGYSDYAITGMMTCWIQESTATGGNWEAGNHPYSTLESFDPTSMNTYGTPTNYQNIRNWAHVWYDRGNAMVSWYPSMVDGYTGETVTLNASGTWAAVKQFPIARQTVDIDGTQYIRPVLNGLGEPVLNIDAPGNQAAANGYGLCQWTPWTKLPSICYTAYNEGDEYFDEGNRHWQLNFTLQLMALEKCREWAMTVQDEPNYQGQWVNGLASLAGFWYNNVFYSYGRPMNWDYWATDSWLPWVDAKLDEIGVTHVPDREWCRRQMAINVWSACYEQGGFYDFQWLDFEEKSLYIMSALRYWNTHGGWSVADIPRARDIPNCELDNYHMSGAMLIAIIAKKRRARKNVRTILF